MDNSLIAGHYDMICAELPHIYSYWELRGDGAAIQDDVVQGTWRIVSGFVVISYHNPEYGNTVLSLDETNVLVGENRWRNGGQFTWRMVKVTP